MTVIKLITNDQLLSVVENPTLAAGDVKSVMLHVDFDDKWDEYGTEAVFFNEKNKKAVYSKVLSLGECEIPHEVLVNAGMLYIGIRGYADGKTKTSTLLKYRIKDGTPVGNAESVKPTANVYQQLLAAYGNAETALEAEIEERKAEVATERQRIDLLSNFVAPQMFGAKGDGITDDTQAILSAIGALSEGSVLYFPKGEYICNADIEINLPKIKILGDGKNISKIKLGNNNSIFIKNHSVEMGDLWIYNGHSIESTFYHVTIKDCQITYMKYGILFKDGYLTQVLNCYICFNDVGVIYDNQSYQAVISNSVIDNNIIGVIITGSSSGVRITDTSIEGNRDKESGVGCAVSVGVISLDLKIDGCWFESNGTTDTSVDVFMNGSGQKEEFADLYSLITSLYQTATKRDCNGTITVEKSHFLFTKHGIAISGIEANVVIKNNTFSGKKGKYNKPIDIGGNNITSNRICISDNKLSNTNDNTINTEMKGGIKNTYVHTDLTILPQYFKTLYGDRIMYDGKPLFVYEGWLSDLTNVKYCKQYQPNVGSGYISGMIDGKTTTSHSTNNYPLYLSVDGESETDFFETLGENAFIVIATKHSTVKFQTSSSWLTSTPIAKGMFEVIRGDIANKKLFADKVHSHIFAVAVLNDAEKAEMHKCIAFKPLDCDMHIVKFN